MATTTTALQSAIYVSSNVAGTRQVAAAIFPQIYYRGPEVMLRWSDDSGHTWKSQIFEDTGTAGKYAQRVRFSRLGRSRQRIYELQCSDPVAWRIVDAYLKADPDYTAQKRLPRKLAETA